MTPQAKTVLAYMKKGNHITALEALGVFGVYRLAARILEIRQAGYVVTTARLTDAQGKQYARYTLLHPHAYTPNGSPIYSWAPASRPSASEGALEQVSA
jgi:hypothetical protein